MPEHTPPPPRVLVCQHGSRHRYAIPRLLHEAGMLAGLYTDSTAISPAGRLACLAARRGWGGARARALAGRIPSGIPREKVRSSDRSLLCRNPIAVDLSGVFRRWGDCGANIVYSMYGEDAGFLEWMKGRGAKIVADVFVHPGTARMVSEESVRVLGREGVDEAEILRDESHSRWLFEFADVLLCPSQGVAEGVRSVSSEYEHKIRVLPYGSSIEPVASPNLATQPGRVLFAGRDPLRKGLHHLAAAASLLQAQGRPVEVRVAGVAESDVAWMAGRKALNFLGSVPMDRMREEFSEADMLVLPSLSEGQAGVVLEAMACGCPVIATRESGVDFEPDAGVTVPVGDAPALAAAIGELRKDRERRNRLASGALRQAKAFSMAAWKAGLAQTMRQIAGSLEGETPCA